MRGRLALLLLALAGFAGCGASCKKGPDIVPLEEGAVVDLPGVDTSSLILTEKRAFTKVVHDFMSPCGDPITLEVCVRESRPCSRCMPAARAVAKLVSKGENDKEIRDWLTNRFDDKSVKSIDVTGSPSLGPSGAQLLIVEFADFECPHCAAAAPMLHGVIDEPEFKNKARFVFKNYPLPGHTHAEAAARASVAAGNQGKFWEMHDQMFTHQEQLEQHDIIGYAKKIGLDMEKFNADWNSAATKDKVGRDHEAGAKIGVAGTPSIFINGRKFLSAGHEEGSAQLKEWMRLELTLGGAPPSAPPPPVAPSTSASASAAAPPSSAPAPSASAAGAGGK
jgi:protein-disulfide isomerase